MTLPQEPFAVGLTVALLFLLGGMLFILGYSLTFGGGGLPRKLFAWLKHCALREHTSPVKKLGGPYAVVACSRCGAWMKKTGGAW